MDGEKDGRKTLIQSEGTIRKRVLKSTVQLRIIPKRITWHDSS